MNPADVGTYPFNPFIFTTTRGHEVHLPGKANTALANVSLFGTGKDNSNPSEGRYYKTSGNLPWALHMPVVFQYPSEKTSIISAYLKFAEWAQSGGTSYPNWYMDEPGHISSSGLFHR
jgi:LruC domain-containing protein